MAATLFIVAILAPSAALAAAPQRSAHIFTTRAATPHGKVLVVGDSLTVGASRYGLVERLRAAGFEPVVRAVNGLSTYRAVKIVTREISGGFDGRLVIVATGTNDAMWKVKDATMGRHIDRVMQAVGRRQVLWVNVYTTDFATHSRRINRVLDTKDADLRRLTVIDWAAHPSARALIHDGVHLTADGYRARARFIGTSAAEHMN